MNREAIREITRSAVRECFALARYQKRRGCLGDVSRGLCRPSCVVYSCRKTQCTGEVSTENCVRCTFDDLYIDNADVGKICAIRKESLHADTKSEA